MARPRMIVVAGPPGSGKTRYFPVTAFGVDSFNIDDRCAQILGSYRAIPKDVRRAVAKECERFVLDHIDRGSSFAVETTLRTAAPIEQAELARKSGFATAMRFVATDSIAENVARVLQRAQAGGHGASEREVRAIHEASVANLRKAIASFDRVRVYDSTTRWAPPRLVAVARGGQLVMLGATPAWVEAARPAPPPLPLAPPERLADQGGLGRPNCASRIIGVMQVADAEFDMLPVAEHEAGHVVVALALGIEVVSASIDPGQTVCGEVFTRSISGPDVAILDARRAALFCLAGLVHENLLAGLYNDGGPRAGDLDRPDRRALVGEPDDIYDAYRFADMLSGSDAAGRAIVGLMETDIEILRRNLEPARAIAAELRRVGAMSGDDLRKVWLASGGGTEPEAVWSLSGLERLSQ